MGKDNPDQLVQITKVLGTKKLEKYLKKFEIQLSDKKHPKLKK